MAIPVESSSSKPSKIRVSGILVTVDRTVTEGNLFVRVGGPAIIENFKDNSGAYENGSPVSLDAGEFDSPGLTLIRVGNIITPAPGDVSGTAVFTIDQTTFTLNGVQQTMDAAPYIKGDRTYVPIRFVARAAGVAESNIIWNEVDQSVILVRGDRVVKLVIGSNQLWINGIAVTMDAAPEIVDPGRTMLPLRAVTQALGCEVTWDAATQTVTVIA